LKNNIQFEVIMDPDARANPEALKMYLHLDGSLPSDRAETEIFATKSVDGVLSVAVPDGGVSLDAQAIFLSVRAGAAAVRFKVVAVVLATELEEDKHSFGEVCPGSWVYYDFPVHSSGGVRFDMTKYEGSVSLKAMTEIKPVRLTYPFVTLNHDHDEEVTSIYVCGVADGDHAYVGVKGGAHCASFQMTPHMLAPGDPCSAETNAEVEHRPQEDTTVALHTGSWVYGHCDSGGWSPTSFKEVLTKDSDPNNLLIEVEVLQDEDAPGVLDPKAVSVWAFDGDVPPPLAEREAEDAYVGRSLEAVGNMHIIFQNYIDVKRVVDHLKESTTETEKSVSFAIKCSEARGRVRFRAMINSVHAGLALDHRGHGEVCPMGWVYHYVDLRPADGTYASSGHRRLGGSSEKKEEQAKHLRVSFRLLRGGVYQVSTRRDYPPGFNSANLYNLKLMAGPDPESTVAFGEVVEYEITLCNALDHKSYVGIFGDESGCAIYDIMAEMMPVGSPCTEGATRIAHVSASGQTESATGH